MKSPLCWMGGKSRLASQIVALIPEHQAYAEVFAGAAWVFFTKPESKFESINDLNSDLVVFYRVLQYHVEEFCRQFKFLLSSREWFAGETIQVTMPLLTPQTIWYDGGAGATPIMTVLGYKLNL